MSQSDCLLDDSDQATTGTSSKYRYTRHWQTPTKEKIEDHDDIDFTTFQS